MPFPTADLLPVATVCAQQLKSPNLIAEKANHDLPYAVDRNHRRGCGHIRAQGCGRIHQTVAVGHRCGRLCHGILFPVPSVRVIPVGIVYAIWSGVGIALIALVGWLILGQKLDVLAIAGIGLIAAGVMVISLFSASVPE